MRTEKTIALVHATFNAVNPITDYLQRNAPEYRTVNYLDGFLMDKIRNDGGISDSCVARMTDMLAKACSDGAYIILMTCTVFSSRQPYFSELFSVPILCPDSAMHDAVSRMGGRTAIICTFEGTVEITRSQYLARCRANGMPEAVDMYTVPEAFSALQAGNTERCHRLIRDKILELDMLYDQIILAQISMTGAAEGLETKHACIFTSPASALKEIKTLLGDNRNA